MILEEITVTIGVKLGGVLFPILFNIVLESVVK